MYSEPGETYDRDMERASASRDAGKRCALFAGDHFYPEGGFNDFIMAGETVGELEIFAAEKDFDWAHIGDLHSAKTVRHQARADKFDEILGWRDGAAAA